MAPQAGNQWLALGFCPTSRWFRLATAKRRCSRHSGGVSSHNAAYYVVIAEPRNGWVSVSLCIGSEELEFSASDVPNNPIEELIGAMLDVSVNREATVWWHLEPDGYYFELSPIQEQVQLRVLFAEHSRRDRRREVACIAGSKQDILLPLWRGLRQFQSFDVMEPHWPGVRYGALEEFGEQLREVRS
jgi:hypothetical protein